MGPSAARALYGDCGGSGSQCAPLPFHTTAGQGPGIGHPFYKGSSWPEGGAPVTGTERRQATHVCRKQLGIVHALHHESPVCVLWAWLLNWRRQARRKGNTTTVLTVVGCSASLSKTI
jgi:hypothetical protein